MTECHLVAGVLPVGRARLPSRSALARSNGLNGPRGSKGERTTGINSCWDISKTKPVIPKTLSGITASPLLWSRMIQPFDRRRLGCSSAGQESFARGAGGTGPAKTSNAALGELKDKPEATRVRLELAYLFQQVGDFKQARITLCSSSSGDDGSGEYARAARLNTANIDAESGAVERARAEYDALIVDDLTDTAARKSRALLELRLGQAERAAIDLTAILEGKTRVKNRDEMLAARALALLILGRADDAVSDASRSPAQSPQPCP